MYRWLNGEAVQIASSAAHEEHVIVDCQCAIPSAWILSVGEERSIRRVVEVVSVERVRLAEVKVWSQEYLVGWYKRGDMAREVVQQPEVAVVRHWVCFEPKLAPKVYGALGAIGD